MADADLDERVRKLQPIIAPSWWDKNTRRGFKFIGNIRRLAIVPVALVILIALVLAVALVRINATTPRLKVTFTANRVTRAPGQLPLIPWPASGQAAVAIPSVGYMQESGPETAVPIASLAKMMTVYLVLVDHPLAANSEGPSVTINEGDEQDLIQEESEDATSVPVTVGETLTERQLINGAIVHSANNLADVLARWDAGSVSAFVVKMNREARVLGMTDTHYTGANGIDPATVSTAGDQLKLAAVAMRNSTFAAVVDQTQVTLPGAGTMTNYVQAVGTDGVVGIKSGFTQAAMGCLVLAQQEKVDGKTFLVLAAATGQETFDPLGEAQQIDLALTASVAQSVHLVSVVKAGEVVAKIHSPWSSKDSNVPVTATSAISVLAWPGQKLTTQYSAAELTPTVKPGQQAGFISVSGGPSVASSSLRVSGEVKGPSLRWRLANG